MTQAPALEVLHLTHRYASRTVLDDIAFAAAPGEILCLLGRSGCGKTTLLRLIAGLDRPQDGRIAIAGRIVTGPDDFIPPHKRGIGLMFQDYALFPHLTTLENATFSRRANTAADAMPLLDRVGLAQAAHRYPHTLSAGEQQRAALVRALMSHPDVMLMDEPFSNLDAGTRDEVRRLTLALLRETGTTAIIVTHDPAEAMMLADRIVLLHEGRVEQIGTPVELYRTPRSLVAARYFSELNEVTRGGAAAYIRPHDIDLVTPGSGEDFRVTDVAYTGENMIVTLASPQARAPLKATVRGDHAVHIGDAVGVTYAPRDLLFFPAADSTSIGR